MKKIAFLFLWIAAFATAQTLTAEGVTTETTTTDFSQKENFTKIKTFAEEYLVNELIQIAEVSPGNSITIHGKEKDKACFMNTLGSKICFELQYTLIITAEDKSYTFQVRDLKAINDQYPDKSYEVWFDESGKPLPALNTCVQGTSEYFQALNNDFLEYIEEGEYW